MKQPFTLTIAFTVSLSVSLLTLAEANDSIVNTKLFFGGKTIDSSAWSAQDGHGSIGILADFHTGSHGIRAVVDLFGSGSEDNTTSQVKGTYTAEAHLGLRKYFDAQSRFKPYIGGGVNLAYATQENDNGSGRTSDEGTDIGLWLNGGVDFLVTDHITAGVDLRYATASVELYDEPVELDAMSTGVSLGYRW